MYILFKINETFKICSFRFDVIIQLDSHLQQQARPLRAFSRAAWHAWPWPMSLHHSFVVLSSFGERARTTRSAQNSGTCSRTKNSGLFLELPQRSSSDVGPATQHNKREL